MINMDLVRKISSFIKAFKGGTCEFEHSFMEKFLQVHSPFHAVVFVVCGFILRQFHAADVDQSSYQLAPRLRQYWTDQTDRDFIIKVTDEIKN